MSSAQSNTSPPRRRLQFRLIWLFALTTLTCLILTWFAWPQATEVTSLVMVPATTTSPAGATVPQPEFVEYRDKLVATFKSAGVLQDAVNIAGNGRLAMFRGHSDRVAWLRDRLEVTLTPSSVISIKLTAPAQFEDEATEVVDYIVLRAMSQSIHDIDPIAREKVVHLRAQQQALRQSINATMRSLTISPDALSAAQSSALNEHKDATAALDPQLARLTADRAALVELTKKIDASTLVDEFIDQVTIIQRATGQGKSRKTLLF